MRLLRTAITSGIALKAFQVARREASKPENQRKIKDLVGKVTGDRRGTSTSRRTSTSR